MSKAEYCAEAEMSRLLFKNTDFISIYVSEAK